MLLPFSDGNSKPESGPFSGVFLLDEGPPKRRSGSGIAEEDEIADATGNEQCTNAETAENHQEDSRTAAAVLARRSVVVAVMAAAFLARSFIIARFFPRAVCQRFQAFTGASLGFGGGGGLPAPAPATPAAVPCAGSQNRSRGTGRGRGASRAPDFLATASSGALIFFWQLGQVKGNNRHGASLEVFRCYRRIRLRCSPDAGRFDAHANPGNDEIPI